MPLSGEGYRDVASAEIRAESFLSWGAALLNLRWVAMAAKVAAATLASREGAFQPSTIGVSTIANQSSCGCSSPMLNRPIGERQFSHTTRDGA